MRVTFRQLFEVPDELLRQWSETTQSESHLAPESPDSLRANLLFAAVAFDGDVAVGFAGLIAARTREGHGLRWDDRQVIELGGAYIRPGYRGTGIWRQLVELRLEYARSQNWLVVCVTGNPTVQLGLAKLGAEPMTEPGDRPLRKELCLSCAAAARCTFCPLVDGATWRLT
jgi:GNAT superfamily N-acetyltransferase